MVKNVLFPPNKTTLTKDVCYIKYGLWTINRSLNFKTIHGPYPTDAVVERGLEPMTQRSLIGTTHCEVSITMEQRPLPSCRHTETTLFGDPSDVDRRRTEVRYTKKGNKKTKHRKGTLVGIGTHVDTRLRTLRQISSELWSPPEPWELR